MNGSGIAYYAGWSLLFLVTLVGLLRIAKGPTIFDRIIGFDTSMIAIVGWIVLFSIHERTGEYLELIILVTAFGFFTTVSYFYYLSQSEDRTGQKVRENNGE